LVLPFFERPSLAECMLDSAGPLQQEVFPVQHADALIPGGRKPIRANRFDSLQSFDLAI
jgi:hypothetical protein